MYTTPASRYGNDYNPLIRPWYQRAARSLVAGDPKMALSAPYVDASSRLLVVTLSKGLIGPDMKPFGVMGMDFELSTIRTLFTESFACPAGSKCFLMDAAGYLINSPEANGDASLATRSFVGAHSSAHADFASGLLASGRMTKDFCLDYATLKRQSFYNVAEAASSGTFSPCGSSLSYVLQPVPNSTFFLVVMSNIGSDTTPGSSPSCCPTSCSTSASLTVCQNPCEANLNLQDRCVSFTPTTADRAFYACPESTPALRSLDDNLGGTTGGTGDTAALSTGAIVGIAIGGVVVLFLLILLIVLCVRKKNSAKALAQAAEVPMSDNAARDLEMAAMAEVDAREAALAPDASAAAMAPPPPVAYVAEPSAPSFNDLNGK
jgi:hypothetical protein